MAESGAKQQFLKGMQPLFDPKERKANCTRRRVIMAGIFRCVAIKM